MLNAIRSAVGTDRAAVSDAQLLERFTASGDEAAFELLLWRHGRLVLGVCRRLLRDAQDAEDAFQATFLALTRKAGAIGKPAAVGYWLYRVACRVALAVRRRRSETVTREQHIPSLECAGALPEMSTAELEELRAVLDEELALLPERFRAPIVLCYLEGLTVDEAAVELSCPRGTVASRLARARDRLRGQLFRRGLALPTGLAGVTLCEIGASAAPPASLILQALLLTTRDQSGVAISGHVVALTERVLRTMFLRKLMTTAAALAVLAGLLVGGGLAFQGRIGHAAQAESARAVQTPAATEDDAKKQPSQGKAPLRVTVSRPRAAEVAPFEVFTGRLEAGQVIQVRPQMSGFVKKIGFKRGSDVKKGDLLYKLDMRPEQAQLEQNKANLTVARAQLQAVRDKLAWSERMVAKGLLSGKSVQEQKANEVAARAAVDAAQAALDQVRATVHAGSILAPIAGRATGPIVDPGNFVAAGPQGTLLTTLMSLDPMRVVFDMDERSYLRYRRLMRTGQVKGPGKLHDHSIIDSTNAAVRNRQAQEPGSPIYLALADEEGFPHRGELDSLDNVVQPQTGTVHARGIVPNPDKLLVPGAWVRVKIPFGKPRRVLEVLESAISKDGDKPFISVINGRNGLERREVKRGERDGDWRVIEKGLRANDWVVVEGMNPAGVPDPHLKVEPRRMGPAKK
jgi:RND family efflux transporter MFP subunit